VYEDVLTFSQRLSTFLRLSGQKQVLDLTALVLDRGSPVPLYFQIERLIEQAILSGRASPGTRVPSEPNLAEHFGVSRSVVRQSLVRLEQEGLLSRVRGRGSFVRETERRSWRLQGSEGFFQEEVHRLGRSVTSRVLRCEIETLPSWAAEALQLGTGARGIVLERIRYLDGRVALYDLNCLPERFAPAVLPLKDVPDGSLYRVLEQTYGLVVFRGTRLIDTLNAGDRFSELLEMGRTDPLIVIEAVDLDANSVPFDCYRTWLRPDRVRLEVEVTSVAGSPSIINETYDGLITGGRSIG
jgi:GntR family transcriptional regulator